MMNALYLLVQLLKRNLQPVLGIILILFAGSTGAQTLVWEDNFDGPAISPDNWTFDFGDGCERGICGWGNQELEYYTSRPENARIEDGKLLIEARKEAFQTRGFTSARLKTTGRMHFKYGTLEARIKVPDIGNGLWPALWTLGTVGGVWPKIGEIDILEMGMKSAVQAGLAKRRVGGATHWDHQGSQADYDKDYDSPVDLNDDYHIYKMVWNSNIIRISVDDHEYFSFNIAGGAASDLEEFHSPHYLLLNLAVGGAYTGIMDAAGITAPLPGIMYVDYVRLYQNPGDELYIGKDHAPSGDFGIYTEKPEITDKLLFGTNARLDYWNNISNIESPVPVPFEGAEVLALHANAGAWFGLGMVAEPTVNLTNFAEGALKFTIKTTFQGQFKVGIKSGHGETWKEFAAGANPYGMARDGNWHEITIPLKDFDQPDIGMHIDLGSIEQAFMFAGDIPSAPADFYLDNIYYSGGVAANPRPSVTITTPANETIITSGTLTINATATDANGTITGIDFYNGATLLGAGTLVSGNEYTFTWNEVPQGIYTIMAKATDNDGGVGNSSVITVFAPTPGNIAPEVSLSTPENNAAFITPATIELTADATDADGIYKVEFYKDDALLSTVSTAPYTYTWTGAVAGSYALTARVVDNGGLATTSAAVNITVTDPVKPTVRITAPADNPAGLKAPAHVLLEAEAADANGTVTKVEFFNGADLIGTSTANPYRFDWENIGPGTYTITAKATDNDGYFTISDPVNITVEAIPCKGTGPNDDYTYEVYTQAGKIYIKFIPNPLKATMNTGLLYFKRADDAGGYANAAMVSNETFFAGSFDAVEGTAYNFYFTYSILPAGENNSSATPHSYTAGAVCAAVHEPVVSITAPAPGVDFTAPATMTIAADASVQNPASGSDVITKVEFYNGAELIGTALSAPYTMNWENIGPGSYTLTAKAYSDPDLSAVSAPVTIRVNAEGDGGTGGYCGTAASGDYSYKVVTAGDQVTFTFHPEAAIAPSSMALLYTKKASDGGYAGYPAMTPVGDGDYTYTLTMAPGTAIQFYFTYAVSAAAGGGERNSLDNPHSYVVGDNCAGGDPGGGTGGTLGVFTEDPAITDRLNYDAGGNAGLFYWNNITDIESPAPVPFEGEEVWALRANADVWFGFGVALDPVIDLSAVADGNLKFQLKTSYAGQFKVGIKSGDATEAWIMFGPGGNPYGVVRDGEWHQVTIPLSAFKAATPALDLTAVSQAFMFSGDAPLAAADFYLDNIYFSGGTAPEPVKPEIRITAPVTGSVYTAESDIVLNAEASVAGGTITKVEFFNGPELLGTVTASPYTYTWHNVAEGSYSITAKATGSNGLDAGSAAVSIMVNAAGNQPQTITFNPLPAQTFGGSVNLTLAAMATSGLPVTFTSSDETIAKIVNGNEVQMLKAGTVTITATQAGNTVYLPAENVPQTLVINKGNQDLTVADLVKKYGDADFDAAVAASSGLPVIYTSSNPLVATVSGRFIHITGAGETQIGVQQAGNENYNPVSGSFTLTAGKADLLITANNLTIVQGNVIPRLGVTYTGFVNGDGAGALTTPPVITVNADQYAQPGTYPVKVNGAASDLYNISYAEGELTIQAAAISKPELEAWFPASGTLQITIAVNSPLKAALAVYNAAGKRVTGQEINLVKGVNSITLPVADLAAGVYVVRVTGTDFKLSRNIVKTSR